MNSENDTSSSPLIVAASVGIARRNLIRAGLAAAPVMLALKSQSALAMGTGSGNHMTCSAWASVKAAGCLSSHTATHKSGTCKGYNHWAERRDAECDKQFHPKRTMYGQIDLAKCVPFEGTKYGDKSLKRICGSEVGTTDTLDKLAKHCAAMYLNIRVDNNCPLDVGTLQTIWNSCKNPGGTWTPVNGALAWTRDDCNAYFDYVCGYTSSSSSGSTCSA